MIDRKGVLGAVLAGGRSARMGQDKSLLRLGGKTLIEHTVLLLRRFFEEVVVVADSPERFGFLGLEIVPDVHKEIGPLGGIHAGLSHARSDLVFFASCDTPLVPPPLVEYLLDCKSPRLTRIPRHLGALQPLFGLYEKRLLPHIEKSIAGKEYRVLAVLGGIEFLPVEITSNLPFYSQDIFSNVNTPDDFAKVVSLFADRSPHQPTGSTSRP